MKKCLLLLLSAIMLLSFVACGPKEKTDTQGNVGAQSTSSGYAAEVVISYSNDLDSADPYQSTSSQTAWYTNATFRTLVMNDYESGELVGVLAESWEDVSNGTNTAWQLKLRQGVKFHDGSEFDADDVVFTWNYAKDAVNVVKPIASADNMVKEVKAIDSHTVRFDLNYAIPDFISYLELKMYSKDAFDTLSKEEAGVIGCGPYKVGKLVSGVSYGLERFDDYYEGIDQFPTKTITCKVIADLNVEVAALQTGEIQYSFRLPSESLATLEADKNIKVYTGAGCMSHYLGFNYRHEVWKDLNMRKAICEAINKDDIIAIYFENGATATRSENFCVPSGKGYTNVTPISYNPEDAKALLVSCDKVGQEVKIMCSAACKSYAETVQAALNNVGFVAVLDEIDGTNWTDYKKTGDYDIFVGDYCSYTGALLYNFDRFFSIGGSSNMFGFESQEWEDLLASVRACSTYDEMVSKFAECQQWAADNIPLVPIAVNKAFAASTKDIGGVKLAPSDNLMEVCYLYRTVD